MYLRRRLSLDTYDQYIIPGVEVGNRVVIRFAFTCYTGARYGRLSLGHSCGDLDTPVKSSLHAQHGRRGLGARGDRYSTEGGYHRD